MILLTGCIAPEGGGDTSTPTSTSQSAGTDISTPTSTSQSAGTDISTPASTSKSPGTATSTPASTSKSPGTATGVVAAENKEVHLINDWNHSVDIQLRIIRLATGETVHSESYTLSPESRQAAYSISSADTDGIESFEVIVTAQNVTARDTFTNDACYGDIHVPVSPDGTSEGPFYGGIC